MDPGVVFFGQSSPGAPHSLRMVESGFIFKWRQGEFATRDRALTEIGGKSVS